MIQFNVSLLFTIINLIVFYLLLKKFLFKPVMGIMEKREKMIADGLKNASDSQEEAARLKAEYEKALEGAKAESIQIVENCSRRIRAYPSGSQYGSRRNPERCQKDD